MRFELRRCDVAARDDAAWRTFHDLTFLLALEDVAEPEWAGELLAQLHAFTVDGDRGRLDALLARRSDAIHQTSAIGHAHLDTAWLWPLEETYRKLIRTTTAQLRLLDDHPGHVFAHSQAQHYAWLRDRAPALYARVKDAVAAGRWIPVGGTWIEPDCNLPSGESLARQFLYGQRFFERELGRHCTEFWNPDVFGYTAQLPQLMREAGITRFLTQKLSWNRFNQPEHHTFTWQGLDGSEVLTHFPPADTYNAEATVAELHRESAAYKDHGRSHHSLLVFGHGDGGGGPTDEMLERLARARDIHGLPPTTVRSPVEFFDDLEADASDLRTVVGELYFELHRGTYTSQAGVKRGNRRAENALHDAELLAALVGSEHPAGGARATVGDAAAQPVPRHPPGLLDQRGQRPRPGRPGGGRGGCRRAVRGGARPRGRAVQHAGVRASRGRGARRRARVRRRAAVRGGRDRGRRTRSRARHPPRRRRGRPRQRAPDGGHRPRRHGHLARRRRPRGALRARQPLRALRGPPHRVGRVGRRPGAPRDARGRHRAAAVDGHQRAPAARRGRLRARLDRAEHPPRRRLAAAGVPHGRRLALRPPLPEGRVPARGARHGGDVRGGVRRRAPAHPLLVARRPGQVRGSRPPLGRHVRARLRRRRAHRLQVRLQRVRRHAADLAPARAAQPGPRGRPRACTPSPTPSSPTPAAGRTRAWSRRRSRSTRRSASAPLSPGSLASVTGGLVLDTVKRAEDSDALVLRLYEPHGGRGVSPHTGTGYGACRAEPAGRAWRVARDRERRSRRCRSDRGRSLP